MQRLERSALTAIRSLLARSNNDKSWSNVGSDVLQELGESSSSHPGFSADERTLILSLISQSAAHGADGRKETSDLTAAISANTNNSGGSAVAELLADLGFSISSSTESMKEVLHPFPKLNEHDIASILIMILRTQYAKLHSEGDDNSGAGSSSNQPSSSGGKSGKGKGRNQSAPSSPPPQHEGWQVVHVIDAIKDSNSGKINWRNVLEVEIDQRRFFIPDERTFQLYVDIYRYATTGVAPGSSASTPPFHLPIDFMLREWKHAAGHLSLLRWALPSSLTVFSYLPPSAQLNAQASRNARSMLAAANTATDACQGNDGDETTTLMSLSSAGGAANIAKDATSNRYQAWIAIDMLESLIDAVPTWSTSTSSSSTSQSPAQSLYVNLRSMLRTALDRCPELLMSGLVSARTRSKHTPASPSSRDSELVTCMLPVHLSIAPHASTTQAFHKIWESGSGSGGHQAAMLTNQAAIFWVMRYWMMNSSATVEPPVSPSAASSTPSASSNSVSLLPPLLLSLGYSLKSFLYDVVYTASSANPKSLMVDLFTTIGSVSQSNGQAPTINFAKFAQRYMSEMNSNASKEMFFSLLFNYLRGELGEGAGSTTPSSPSAASVVSGGDGSLPPFRLSLETVAVCFKTLLSVPNPPQSLINEVQSVLQHYPALASHMRLVGQTMQLGGPSSAAQHGGLQLGAQMAPHSSMLVGGGSGSVSGLSMVAQQQQQQLQGVHQLNDSSMGGTIAAGSSAASGPSASSEEIEEEANQVFQKIYNGTLSLESVIDMLLRYQTSGSRRERDVCTCMLHNLFDEYRFFHKYPLRELQITGLLFGSLIANKLLTPFQLGIALRLVLEALRKVPDTKLFSFGMWAVQQFKQRITVWPHYALMIMHIPHMQQAQHEFVSFLQQIVQTHTQNGTMDAASTGEPAADFSPQSSTAFSAGFNAETQNFANFTSLIEAERHADMQATATKQALDRASASVSTDSNLPPGLRLASSGKATPSPSPSLASSVVLNASTNAHNPAGAIGGANRGVSGGAVSSVTGHTSTGTSSSSAAHTFGSTLHTLNIDSLLSAEGEAPLPAAPSDAVKDKIHFIINNVTKSNLRQKGRELKSILSVELLPYFSRYLVIKRVSIEANFQRLYAAFLDYVGMPELRRIMLETTYMNIAVLLRNDKIVSSSSERSLLKNLGSWLGLLTIAKNQPIRSKYLDLKNLILEAYDTGRLIAVIPFTAKVLESCSESRVFKPPNPWLMAVVGLLREIFDLPGLKLNLKFEIEVLFNHLQLTMKPDKPGDVNVVRPTNLLRHRTMHALHRREKDAKASAAASATAAATAGQGGTPFPLLPTPGSALSKQPTKAPAGMAGSARSPSPNMSEEEALRLGLSATGSFGQVGGGAAGATSASPASPANTVDSLLPNIGQYVVLSPQIVLFQLYPNMKRYASVAIERAIREIINPVVERSLAIACVTTRELILKDFSCEPDENKMRAASNSMVSNLTSSLALVTCREPLRVSISNHLQQLLEQAMSTPNTTNPNDRQLIERASLQVANDNLDLGTTLIEKAAADRAIREIDEQLAPVYQIRRKTREQTGQGYIDMTFFQPGHRYPAALPEALRAKPGAGLSAHQLRVYEDFNNIRQQHAAAAAAPPMTGAERPAMKEATAAAATATTPSMPSTLMQSDEAKKAAAGGASGFGVPPTAGRMVGAPGTGPSSDVGAPSTRSPPLQAAQPSNLTSQQTLDKLLGYLATLEQAVLRFPNHKSIPIHSLTTAAAQGQGQGGVREDQEINVLMRLITALLQQTSRDESNYPKDLVPLTFALKVFKRLYERENRSSLLQIDVHIGVLKCVRSVCPKLVPELTTWLLYADDDRKFILPITAGLLRARLLHTPELDSFLSKLASQIFASGQAVATTTQPAPAGSAPGATQTVQVLHPQFEFILVLVRRVVVKRPIVSVAELGQLLETLNKIGQAASQQRPKLGLLADHIAHLLEDVRAAAMIAEKERAEQALANAHTQAGGGDGKALPEAIAAGMPLLSIVDQDEPDAMDRLLEQDEAEPPGLRQQVMYLLDDWMSICMQQGQSDSAYTAYLNMLQQQRLLATPESTRKFFRMLIQLCVDSALHSIQPPPPAGPDAPPPPAPTLSYTAIDALSKLFVFISKFLEQSSQSVGPNGQPLPAPASVATASKIMLLRSFLSAAVLVLRKDHQYRSSSLAAAAPGGASGAPSVAPFNQRPYLRLFNNLLHDLNTPDPLLDSNHIDVLIAFAQHFRYLRPQRVPGFLFAWLELISHRMFMPKLLLNKAQGQATVPGSAVMARLLCDLFRFLHPYLRQADLSEVLRVAYKGTLRLLLVLLHDFPEFLCEYHFAFCDVIPPTCIQMRNLILSAFPRSMRLPDPFTPNLKVDLLPEMTHAPRISSELTAILQQPAHRHTILLPLDHYLKHREPQAFFKQLLDGVTLRAAVLHTSATANPAPSAAQLDAMHAAAVKCAGTHLNVPLINAIVLYTGMSGIQSLVSSSGKSGLVSQFQDSAAMDVYEALLAGMDAEGRYYVLNALANQLRYPNNHTHYFSCVLLYLFLQCKDELLMEQMTRVLLERLIVHRPHPWGLLITFIELIKNPRYDFWRQPFTRCAPEIERLFESVARSCMPPKANAQTQGQAPPTQPQASTDTTANHA